MKIDLFFTHTSAAEEKLKNRTAAVIDVLRASSTICEALRNGAKEIVPLAEVSEAMELAGKLSREKILLCGEREGKIIPGYDLGNSPLEYTREIVEGKTLLFTSTNGSAAMVKASAAKNTVIACFNNISAAADYILRQSGDLTIICSGTNQQFSMDDAVCGGMLAHFLTHQCEGEVELSDAAEAACVLYHKFQGKIPLMLAGCAHGSYLRSLGYDYDLKFCGRVDSTEVAPVLKEGKIVLNDE